MGRGPAPTRLPALPLAVASAAAARDVLGKPKPREKMPAILVASKMKSGLPKPVHSAAPILHVPPARTGHQPCYLKLGSKVEVSKTAYTSQIPLKSQGLQEPTAEGLPLRKSSSLENGFDTQVRGAVYSWALLGVVVMGDLSPERATAAWRRGYHNVVGKKKHTP